MKKLGLLIAVLGLLFISACKDDETTNPGGDSSFNKMKTSVDVMSVKMDTMSMTMDPDYDFAMMMIPHHEGAIELANILLQTGHHDSTKKMAQAIITSQSASITKLREYMRTHTPMHHEMDSTYMHQMDMSMMNMMNGFNDIDMSDDPDINFARFMIVHHQGAIDMAQATIDHGMDEEIHEEAHYTIDEQNNEITRLNNFLKGH